MRTPGPAWSSSSAPGSSRCSIRPVRRSRQWPAAPWLQNGIGRIGRCGSLRRLGAVSSFRLGIWPKQQPPLRDSSTWPKPIGWRDRYTLRPLWHSANSRFTPQRNAMPTRSLKSPKSCSPPMRPASRTMPCGTWPSWRLPEVNRMAAHEWLCSKGLDRRLSMFPLFPHEVTDDAERVRIAAAASDPELAEHAIALAERRALLNPQVRSCRAAAAHVRGIWFESATELEVAVDLYRDGPRPLAYASALEDLGRVHIGSGQTQSAVRSFEEALSVTTGVGAEWDSARIRGRLRRLGVRRRYPVNTRPKTGWAALTEPEIKVARLAAEGRTNRQIAAALFVSPHTVNTHLRHVFEKLGINSRVQLTRFVQEQSS